MADVLAAPHTPVPDNALDEALRALFALGVVALHARGSSLYLRGDADERDVLLLRHETGLAAHVHATAARIPVDGTVAGLAVRTRVPLLVQNVADYAALPLHPERYETPSFMSVPILVENDAVGVLNAADRHDGQPFSEDDLQCAEMVARSMAAVLHSDSLARRAAGQGEVDPVTGLYTLTHLEKRLTQEVQRTERDKAPLTLLLLRVQEYADLVARMGPQVGGVLMRCVSEMVAHTVRQSDVLACSAPDEIAILLPSTPLDKARRVARLIAREVTHQKLPAHLRYDLENLSVHIGLSALGAGMDGAALLQRARDAVSEAYDHGDVIAEAVGEDVIDASRRHTRRSTNQQAIVRALNLGVPYLADPAGAALPSAVHLIGEQTARQYLCFPVAHEGGVLTLAMADPSDADAIQLVSEHTGMSIYPVSSPRERILQAIAKYMDGRAPRQSVRIALPTSTDAGTFAAQLQGVAGKLRALTASGLTIDAIITVQAPAGLDCRALLSSTAAASNVSLRPDPRDRDLLRVLPVLE